MVNKYVKRLFYERRIIYPKRLLQLLEFLEIALKQMKRKSDNLIEHFSSNSDLASANYFSLKVLSFRGSSVNRGYERRLSRDPLRQLVSEDTTEVCTVRVYARTCVLVCLFCEVSECVCVCLSVCLSVL